MAPEPSSTTTTTRIKTPPETGPTDEPPSSSSKITARKETALTLNMIPNEILEKIMAFCDLRTYKSMRQVCRRFQQVCDTKEALFNFNVAIHPNQLPHLPDLVALTQSLPWSNLFLDHFQLEEILGNDSTLNTNLEKLSLVLKSRNQRPGFGLKSINCPLRMDFVGSACNFCTMRPFLFNCWETLESIAVLRMTEIRSKLLPAVLENGVHFPKLSYLHVAFDLSIEYTGDALSVLLNLTPNLKILKLLFPDQDEHPMTKESFEISVLTPLLNYLKNRRQTSIKSTTTTTKFPTKPQQFLKYESPKRELLAKSLCINFSCEGDKASIPFTFGALEKLLSYSKSSPTCPTGIDLRLENVPFLALPTKRKLVQAQQTDPDILDRLNYTVKSIVGTIQDLKLSTMEIERDSFHSSCRHFMPPEAKFSIIVYLPTMNKIYLTCPAQLLPTDVQSITIVSENKKASLLLSISDEDNQWGEDKNKCFIEDLLDHRPGLHELKILTINDKKSDGAFLTQESPNFKHIGTFYNFPNLKILHLDFWGRKNEDFFELYDALPLLEELVLHKCYNLSDQSIVGVGGGGEKNKSTMLQLKYLNHLVLNGFLQITDVSFVKVFSKLPLKTLQVWDDQDKLDKLITIQGIQAISSPTSKCCATLEHLKINKPYKASLIDVKQTLMNCRALKNAEILIETGPGASTKNIVYI